VARSRLACFLLYYQYIGWTPDEVLTLLLVLYRWNPDTSQPSTPRDHAPPLLRQAQAWLSLGSGLRSQGPISTRNRSTSNEEPFRAPPAPPASSPIFPPIFSSLFLSDPSLILLRSFLLYFLPFSLPFSLPPSIPSSLLSLQSLSHFSSKTFFSRFHWQIFTYIRACRNSAQHERRTGKRMLESTCFAKNCYQAIPSPGQAYPQLVKQKPTN